MRGRWPFSFLVLVLASNHVVRGQEGPKLAYGTLITIMGNKAGVVAMTDSRVTYVDTRGTETPYLEKPVQTLMQYDEHRVCAVAGVLDVPPSMFGKPQDELLKKLDLQVLGLIQFYGDAVKRSGAPPQSMADTLDGLSAVIRSDFQIISDINSSLMPEFNSNYHLELFLAGLDFDGELKVGRRDIVVKREEWPDGRLHMIALELRPNCDLLTVKDVLSVCSGGLDKVEHKMREHPERYFSIPIMRAYASSLRKDKGASLSIAQLKQLGHAFKEQTLDKRVGGPEQTAVITVKGLELELPTNLPRVKRPQQLLFAACPPGTGLVFSSHMPEPKVPVVFQHCEFASGGEEISLDGYIYLKCSF